MKCFCKTKCFFKARLWSPGESLEIGADEEAPEHFSKQAPAPASAEKEGPRTFSEMAPKPVEIPDGPVAMSQLAGGKKSGKH